MFRSDKIIPLKDKYSFFCFGHTGSMNKFIGLSLSNISPARIGTKITMEKKLLYTLENIPI